jgi:AraC-like DNA-binding protein
VDILKQLNDAAVYIETNLCGEVVLEELAQIACVTQDSFLCFFSYMTGMTLNGYIRRRRLSLAAYELRESDIYDCAPRNKRAKRYARKANHSGWGLCSLSNRTQRACLGGVPKA